MKYFLLISFLIFKISHSFAAHLETYECDGTEVTVAFDQGKWGEYSCLNGEWFLRINESVPFTMRPEKSREMHSDEYDYYNMVPTVPVNAKTRWILRRHWFRVDLGGRIEFVPKRAE